MDTLSLVSEYLKDLEECMDDGDSKVAKEAKLFDALEHKSVVIEVDNQKIAIFTKAPLRAFGEPFMRKMVNDVNVEIHGVKFKADFVVLDYVNEGEPSIMFGRDFLVTTKSQVDFGLGEIRMNLTKFKEGIEVIDLTEEVGSSSEEVVKMGKANRNKGYNINKLTPPPSLKVEEIPPTSAIVIIGLDDRVRVWKSRKDTLPNPLIAEYRRKNKRNTITYSLQPVSNANIKWKDLPSIERHAYCEKLSKLQKRSFRVQRVANWRLFNGYGFEDTLREMVKLEYIYEGDGDVFVDYS
ncbi:hypothetical protein Tco_1128150 [Tanacetum coccineum]